jgi:hypothetical protein
MAHCDYKLIYNSALILEFLDQYLKGSMECAHIKESQYNI